MECVCTTQTTENNFEFEDDVKKKSLWKLSLLKIMYNISKLSARYNILNIIITNI